MFELKRLSKVYDLAEHVVLNKYSRVVIMSDCHRGDGNWSDTFSKNQNIYLVALTYYDDNDFTYIELGDGDELWENKKFLDILNTYRDIFKLLSKFYLEGKLYFIYGNHDMEKKNHKFVEDNLFYYFDDHLKENIALFKNIKIHEGLILEYLVPENEIFLLHGHQVDFMNDKIWRLTRFLVKYLWKPLEIYGVNDPTRTAKNYKKKKTVEKKLSKWARKENKLLIAGHTHKPMLPEVGESPYFNDGSCVHPRSITAIEINSECIMLVEWSVKTKNDGTLFIDREVIAGPTTLNDYFKKGSRCTQ